ncbi:ribonuclease M5 [Virgibacillus halophilus]|uniref:ribonuclease M5 n=1 Tax=Tigheibacillus halophilus TaxID=361280 RepID=UPI00363065E8
MKIKEIIVVEGKDDTVKIKAAVDADTIETNGSAIDRETLDRIRHAKEKRGVIIFTDPDYPGQRIRSLIEQAVPGCKHAFLTKAQARAKRPKGKSLGIEHATAEAIRHALQGVYEPGEERVSDITQDDLLALGLVGGTGSSNRRKQIGEMLKIGDTNGKQLLKRLQMFQITKTQLAEAVDSLKQEDHHD